MEGNKAVVQKVSEIVTSLNEELAHRRKILSRYKMTHCLLTKSQLLLNSISIACGSSTAVTLATGIGSVPGVVLSIITASTAGIGVLCNLIDSKVLSKIHKHYQLMILARTLDLKLFQKYLYDEQISSEDFNQIMDMMANYFRQKDLIETKNLFVSGNINDLAKQFKQQLNGKQFNHTEV